MKKKKTYNILIAVLAVIVLGCGVMAVGTFNGWFGGEEGEPDSQVAEETAPAGTEAAETESTEAAETEEQGDSGDVSTCTICIKCTNVLKHMDGLKSGKEKCVPSNGIILATSTIEFRDGESVYDILKRSASAAGIPVSARNSSYGVYVEGINGLFEFDCGGTSGWMYSVNGSTPGHSCSSHKVHNGDSIVWYYTCGK